MMLDKSMSDELRIRQLLEEILDSERTPEEVYRDARPSPRCPPPSGNA